MTMMAGSQSLNSAQKDAVLAPLNCASLCVAGPGSGKTKVLTTRIAYLVKNLRIHPSSIVAITFTNKASKEMRSRLQVVLGDAAESVEIGTFHSFGSKMLRQAGRDHLKRIVGEAIDENFTIWDQGDCLKLTKELMTAAQISDTLIKPNSLLNAIGNLKEARCMSLTTASANGEYAEALSKTSRLNRAAYSVIDEYEKKLHLSNAMDFQDLLLNTYNLFKVEEVQSLVNQRFRHVLVDEYQDTNVPQYEIVRMLSPLSLFVAGESDAKKSRSLFCVGDTNQAIYSWRGARPGNMDQLGKDYPNMQTFGLLENYRCSPAVITVANAMLGSLATTPRAGIEKKRCEPARIITCEDDADQAQCVSKLLQTLRGKTGAGEEHGEQDPSSKKTKHKEIAIMYRTNAQSRVLEAELVAKGIKHVLLGGKRFYDRKEVKDLLSFLRLLNNPYDRPSAIRAMEEFGTGIGPKTVASFTSWIDASVDKASQSKGTIPSIFHHFESLVESTEHRPELADPPIELTKRGEKALLSFAEQFLELRSFAINKSLPDLLMRIKSTYFTKAYMERASKSPQEAEDRIENVEELLKAANKYAGEESCISSGQLRLFLEEAALLSGDDNEAEMAAARGNGEVVYLMTIHASKGLEFDTVFLTGAEEGVLPLLHGPDNGGSDPEDDTDEVAEERRLAFVAVTRAKSLLFILNRKSSFKFQAADSQGLGGAGMRTVTMKPSRFIEPLLSINKEHVVSLKWKSTE